MARPRSLAARQELARAYQLFEGGDFASAIEAFRAISVRQPRNAEALYMIGVCELQLGFIEQARDHIEAAIARTPNAARYYYDLGMSFRALGDLDAALATFDRMLLLSPGHEWALAGRADIMVLKGDADAAFAELAPLLQKGFTEVHAAVAFADVALLLDRLEEGLAVIEPFARDESVPPARRTLALFRWGDLLRRLHRDDEAFHAYALANGCVVDHFEPQTFASAVSDMITGFTEARIHDLRQAGDDEFAPVFIVGMPRSGTSLVEQILDAHPQFTGAGELETVPHLVSRIQNGARVCSIALLQHPQLASRPTITQSARRYRDHLQQVAPDAALVSDKMPTNFLHLGLIGAMFPNARVVHCRRDPMDTCLSCYMHHFGGLHPYASDLSHLGHFWNEYDRLMHHWQDVLPNPMIEVQYEELVADQATQSRRLIEFVGLPWDDACLRFHENERLALTASHAQVRRPIYRSAVRRWKRFDRHLGPLREALHIDVDSEADAVADVEGQEAQ